MKALTISELHQNVELNKVKGFLANDEAEALWRWAQELGGLAPCLEIGSYCGKSTIYLASGCAAVDGTLYAVDHHRGSEEHQLGEEYHDPDLFDSSLQVIDSFPVFRKNVDALGLSNVVIPVVASSQNLVRAWATPLSLVFIDGGHSEESALHDCKAWSQHIIKGGILAVHDLFAQPEDGGQGPYNAMQAVLQKGEFEWVGQVRSLGFARRI